METKVALIQLLKKYTFVRAPETEVHTLVRFNAYEAIYTVKISRINNSISLCWLILEEIDHDHKLHCIP